MKTEFQNKPDSSSTSPLFSRRSFIKAQLSLTAYLAVFSLNAQNHDQTKNELIKVKIQERKSWEFEDLTFDNKFSGSRLSDVTKNPDGSFHLLVEPETKPINASQWYGFRITSKEAKTISVEIEIDCLNENNQPMVAIAPVVKNSLHNWVRIPADQTTINNSLNRINVNLEKGENCFAPFEPVTLEDCNQWIEKLKKMPSAKEEIIGRSIEGRPLRKLSINANNSKQCIFVLGGQHPPEMTGSLGLFHFIEEVCANNELSNKFRDKYEIVAVPMINPDGRYHGHWRCNLGGN